LITTHPRAGVNDNTWLVSLELCLNAGEGASKGGDDCILGGIFDEPVSVIAFAGSIGATVTLEGGVILVVAEGERSGAGEVVDGAGLGGEDLAGREGALVSLEVTRRVGQVQNVVPNEIGFGILIGIKVEVRVLRKQEC